MIVIDWKTYMNKYFDMLYKTKEIINTTRAKHGKSMVETIPDAIHDMNYCNYSIGLKKGVSILLRIKNEENKIVSCIESVKEEIPYILKSREESYEYRNVVDITQGREPELEDLPF